MVPPPARASESHLHQPPYVETKGKCREDEMPHLHQESDFPRQARPLFLVETGAALSDLSEEYS